MYRFVLLFVLGVVAVPFLCVAENLRITPTTTQSALVSNNTSAADDFGPQSNGNPAASNVSKVNVHSLLYPGAKTKIYAHLVLWFGKPGHLDIGYNSTDAAQVKRQINDMVSRGIDGVMMVWYGPHSFADDAALQVMQEAERHPGFKFAIMVDHGAIAWDSCGGCAPQEALTRQMQYLEQTYFSSPAYLRLNGRPVVTNFDIDLNYSINWSKLSNTLSDKPSFLFQNSSGFGHALSNGAYSWVVPKGSDYGMGYLKSFYKEGKKFPHEQTWGASYKGFDDALASWGSNRSMGQQCGQTWLQTFSAVNHLYSPSNPLPSLQLVTWNDYEEGTEIESGIENCLGISASVSGDMLQWIASGNENTLDHYTAYISNDGHNLMPLADLPTSMHSLDLCSYSLNAGNYTLFIQAVGKPSIKNHLSEASTYTPHCSASESSRLVLKADPPSLTIKRGHSANVNLVVTSNGGIANTPVKLSCPDLPQGISCAFSPASISPSSGSAKSVLTISTAVLSASHEPSNSQHGRLSFAVWLWGFPLAGIVFTCERKRMKRMLIFCIAIVMALLLTSCGGGEIGSSSAPGAYEISIQGISGAVVTSTQTKVTLQ